MPKDKKKYYRAICSLLTCMLFYGQFHITYHIYIACTGCYSGVTEGFTEVLTDIKGMLKGCCIGVTGESQVCYIGVLFFTGMLQGYMTYFTMLYCFNFLWFLF